MNISANQLKTIILGHDRGTDKPQELHIGEDGRFVVVEGDWLWGAFKRKAKYLTKKNGFSREEWTLMEAEAIYTIMNAVNGYDPSKGDYKSYLNTVVGNALREAAKKIADERSVWSSMKSLDACVGADGEGATHKDRILDGAGLEANAKLIEEPNCRVVSRKLRERKDDERAKRALLRRLAADAVYHEPEDEDTEPLDPDTPLSPHDVAVREVGYYEDEDEVPITQHQAQGTRHRTTGFGDSLAALYENALHYDVAIVMQGLEPKLRKWCENMFEGYTPTEAYRRAGITRGQWYNTVQPKLQEAFKHLKYAL